MLLLVGYHGELKVKRLTFFIIQGLYRDYTTPKRLKATTRCSCSGKPKNHKEKLFYWQARVKHGQQIEPMQRWPAARPVL